MTVHLPSARITPMARCQGQARRGSIRLSGPRRNVDRRQESVADLPRYLRCGRGGVDRGVLDEGALDEWQVAKPQANIIGHPGAVFPANFGNQVSGFSK